MNKKALKDLYQLAVNIEMGLEPFSIHPDEGPRLGASDSLCSRRAYLGYVRMHHKKPFNMQTQRKFAVGDIFHKMSDEGIDKALWDFGGEIFRIPPFRLRCFEDVFACVAGLPQSPSCVDGTPDHVLYIPSKKMIILNDQKSSNDYGFKKNKKDGAIYHGIQVGTYLNGLMNSPIAKMVNIAECFMCYMSKEAVEIAMPKIQPLVLKDARNYWTWVRDAFLSENSKLPPALPREPWACRYCDFFDDQEQCNECITLADYDEAKGEPLGEEQTT